MALKVIVKPLVELDIQDAIDWYIMVNEEKLAERFFNDYTDAIHTITKHPFIFQKVYKSIRLYCLNIFPYNIYYIAENNIVSIIAVIHHKRHSRIWKKRYTA